MVRAVVRLDVSKFRGLGVDVDWATRTSTFSVLYDETGERSPGVFVDVALFGRRAVAVMVAKGFSVIVATQGSGVVAMVRYIKIIVTA
ncbi:MAG: hypothetical protein M1833_007260 [Piccolia ochrophora]|nr:MAG: hypothetical protein M1833_007260 [Piccolia ochrophora]